MNSFLDFISFWRRNKVYSLGVRETFKYRKAMKEYLLEHPNCEYCGRSKKVDVHHEIPVSVAPELATEKSNMITLCRKPACHLIIGHFGDFKKWNKNARKICEIETKI